MTACEPIPFTFPDHPVFPRVTATFNCASGDEPEYDPSERSRRGKFLVFDGIDGTGKTTQVKRASDLLHDMEIKHVVTKQPGGGSMLGDHIRKILFDEGGTRTLSEDVLSLLFDSNELHNSFAIIEPALAAGQWVITDRYWQSALAYRVLRPTSPAVTQLRKSLPVVAHDAFFWMTGDPEKLIARANSRVTEVHQQTKRWNNVADQIKVNDAFSKNRYASKTVMIDATQPIDVIFNEWVRPTIEHLAAGRDLL